MSGNYQDGTTFVLVLDKNYVWGLGLINNLWSLRPEETTNVSVYIDSMFITSGTAKHIDQTMAYLPLSGLTVYRALQVGNWLELRTPYGNLKYGLAGTRNAMNDLLRCVVRLNQESASTASIAQEGPANSGNESTDKFYRLNEGEAAVMLANLLNAAGVRGFRIDPPQPNSGFASYSLADGTRGWFVAARGRETTNADDYSGYVLSQLTSSCKGEFLSAKQSVPSSDGTVIRKLVSTCRVNGVGTITETTIIRKPDGFLAELSQSYIRATSTNGANVESQDASDRSAVVDAAIQLESPQ